MAVVITQEAPDSPDAATLVDELEAHLAPLYPVESRHGLSVQRLIAENVAFFVLRTDGTPAACGGVKLYGSEYGEVKRMYVRPEFRGRGFAKLVLSRLEDYTRAQDVDILRLETGIHQQEAVGLYEGAGYHRIPPFGPYWDDPVSLCYEKRLARPTGA
ncbi:MAG: GNAT family N-acetyltransferase [Anaerolineae bacterium]